MAGAKDHQGRIMSQPAYRWDGGGEENPADSVQLLSLVYHRLQRLAAWRMAHECSDQPLQPAELVHEAYLRLLKHPPHSWNTIEHFFNAMAEVMRRILIDQARRKNRLKRGGHSRWNWIALEETSDNPEYNPPVFAQVHDALNLLARTDPFKAELVRLKFFEGLGNTALALRLGISEPTVKRHWAQARDWLGQVIKKKQRS